MYGLWSETLVKSGLFGPPSIHLTTAVAGTKAEFSSMRQAAKIATRTPKTPIIQLVRVMPYRMA